MASIEEVKAALAQAADQGNTTLNQIRAATESTEQMLTRLRAVAAGTGHAKITEAIARAEQSRQRLNPGNGAQAMAHPLPTARASGVYLGTGSDSSRKQTVTEYRSPSPAIRPGYSGRSS